MEVREVRPEEYEEAGRVTRRAYEEFGNWGDYGERLADVAGRAGRTLVLVAVEDDRILGTTTLEVNHRIEGGRPRQPLRPEEAHIRMLGVAPDARSRGVGRALVEACIREARRHGKSVLTLHTAEEMTVARAMYEAMGFTRMEDEVYPDGFVLLGYRLPL